ncbi:unnamed protein product [Bursaphelenchus okinawaensis]|uniref:CCD97-like C-terminal domain-containing protein n=1 Tax=Bursaphelenchus okinawaensis TaxID=465554 RepID=A0A811LR54_9BILA|nr:unnamed protein product [Bursaphelenchus okinawaensis]CAG9127298.1 unnamed protein product [Bursaphelenchus okinawaensis]
MTKPSLFLQRYHQYIGQDDLKLFEDDEANQIYFDLIRRKKSNGKQHKDLRNQRFLAMQQLKTEGEYFSLDKMRERDPDLFDLMLGAHLNDDEKQCLRPTVELKNGEDYSDYIVEYEQCCSEETLAKRKKHIEDFEKVMKSDGTDRFLHHVDQHEDDEFEVEFDSDDEDGRNKEIERQARLLKQRKEKEVEDKISPQEKLDADKEEATEKLSILEVSNSEKQKPASDADNMDHDQRVEEFRTIMEERFLDGKDSKFYDYNKVGESAEYTKMVEQDEEDAYFDED